MLKIPIEQLEYGRVYRVDARNFRIAVYVGKGVFRGVRRKWGSTFVDDELHWDADENFGTVRAMEPTVFVMHPPLDGEDMLDRLLAIGKQLSP